LTWIKSGRYLHTAKKKRPDAASFPRIGVVGRSEESTMSEEGSKKENEK